MKVQKISLRHIFFKCIYDNKLYNKNCITVKMLTETLNTIKKDIEIANKYISVTKVFYALNNNYTPKDFVNLLQNEVSWIIYLNHRYYIDYTFTNKDHNSFPMIAPTCASDIKDYYRNINPCLYSLLFGTKINTMEQ